jgi:AcrR family transcriptional regulator
VVGVSTLRADAQRNLERIVEAARAVFAEHGLEASAADTAQRAGVGTATIFRRFPTKEDLVVAVVEEDVRAICEHARTAASLREFMTHALAYATTDRGFCEAGGSDLFEHQRLQALVGEFYAAVDELLARQSAAGEVRDDVVAADIAFLLQALSQARVAREQASRGLWQRYLDIVLDGLQPEGAHPLSRKAPTPAQLTATKRRRTG